MGFDGMYPLVMTSLLLKMAIDIVSCPIKNGDFINSHVKLPEGHHQLKELVEFY